MQKITTLFLLGLGLYGYSQDILWEKSYGGQHAEYLFDAQPTADYGFILAGSSLSKKTGKKTEDNNGDLDFWLWKMDEKGQDEWQKNIGGSGADLLQSIRTTQDGGFILAGTSESNKGFAKLHDGKGKEDYWIIKLNAKGDEQWQQTFGGSGQDRVTAVIQTRDGGYFIGGSSSSSPDKKNLQDPTGKSEASRGNLDYWVIKLDSKGKMEWQKTMGGQYADILESLQQTTDGGYILGGYSNSPSGVLEDGRRSDKTEEVLGYGDFWIVKLDAKGEEEWQQTLGGEGDDHLYSIIQTQDGNYIAAGNSNSNRLPKGGSTRDTDFWLIKLDEYGQPLWSRTYDFGKTDILTSLTENKDRTLMVGGYSKSSNVPGSKKKDKEGINDYIALKLSATGDELWSKTVGSNGEDLLKKLVETRDGGYILAGTSTPNPASVTAYNKGNSRDRNTAIGKNDFWVVKLLDKDKPKDNRLNIQAVPNPAQQFTNVIVGYEYNTGNPFVYDLGGRLLQSFAIENRTVPVDLSTYPEGIYIVQIKTDVQEDSVKVVKGIEKH
ncbi:T9SS type A sorting domain-containing protein [Flavobacterium kingsejongi]|uniref:Secretion system C-terminal sorting domain-containing protein n=1 Tax=Flavobacterium kingsejongi TaxID=1678728 RepID=A0A2S1LLC1_9FLAO|nr:T9SS type A sorting domain-containing protein [Flavobacterium kingsejongi]AWG24519.1 hypothetical protein FK004_04340 [Flavobacterium kingsejongi]